MKALLAKISMHRALGLYVGEKELVLSQVASTPLGLIETARASQPYESGDLETAVPRLLASLLDSHKSLRLAAVGLPTSRLFFITRPVRSLDGDAKPEVLLQKALQSPNVVVDDLIVDMLKSEVNKAQMATVAACRKKYLHGVLTAAGAGGVRLFRAEPAPCALVRAAAQEHRAPRKAKIVLRIFLGQSKGLAILIAQRTPIAWRDFPLPPGGEAGAVLSAARTMQTLSRHYGLTAPLDVAMLHGRADLHAPLGAEEFGEEIGMRVLCYEGPAMQAGIAFGLALGCLNQGQPGFDLSRGLKPRPSLREIFPWGELALQTSLMICVALLFTARSAQMTRTYQAAKTETSRHKCLRQASEADLQKEKTDLQQKVDAIRHFVESRVLWSAYTHDLPGRLPPHAQLASIQGLCELEHFGAKSEGAVKPKKTFVLRASAPLAADGSSPREIEVLLSALRNHPLLKQDFPDVELADIKRFQLYRGAPASANFTVICQPKAKAFVAEIGAGGDKKKAP